MDERSAQAMLIATVRAFVLHSGDQELVRNIETANTIRLNKGYFRTCIPNDDRDGWTCFFVDVRRSRAKVIRDPSVIPNPPR